jgi:hypothetical protein
LPSSAASGSIFENLGDADSPHAECGSFLIMTTNPTAVSAMKAAMVYNITGMSLLLATIPMKGKPRKPAAPQLNSTIAITWTRSLSGMYVPAKRPEKLEQNLKAIETVELTDEATHATHVQRA